MLHFIHDEFINMSCQRTVPDVILNHERVANHYLVPSISCAQEISERINKVQFTWETFGGIHPSWFGHKFYVAAINDLFDNMWSHPSWSLKKHPIPELLVQFSYVRWQYLVCRM